MWIQVRSMDGSKNVRIDDLSKLTKVEELRERLVEPFTADPSRQRLFYRGKQLEDSHTLFDYDVGLNDIIQLMVRPIVTKAITVATPITNGTDSKHENGTAGVQNGNGNPGTESSEEETEETNGGGGNEARAEESSSEEPTIGLYRINDKVDARDTRMGAWFEGQVVKVTEEDLPTSNQPGSSNGTTSEPTIYYHVKFDDYSDEDVAKLTSADIRPRARYRLQWDQVSEEQCVMVNYNLDHPRDRGFWYDAVITRKNNEKREIFAKLVLGSSSDASQEIKVKFVDEIFRIETRNELGEGGEEEVVERMKKPDCDWCKDNLSKKCKHCACCVCGEKSSPDKQILCDECDMAYHLWCLTPKLKAVPDTDDWYCPTCKTDSSEVIGAGEKMRLTKKKANMMSKKHECNRDWGKGMACVGRTKMCTIVPSNHCGPIPGVPVGSLWKFRVQVSESGVHRPHVAGIHGRENEGAYSIVLSGGYDDDVDNGEEFTYSGSGGRDLSGNKRTAKQSMDQKLTAMNRALARNCDAPIDDKNGATGKSWKNGKPVRVVRNHKGCKTSEYSPEEGNRYDGIYKIVRYWPEKGKTGFIVWKYLIRRDDPSPAPWGKEGIKMTKKLGLTMQYPEGYLEAQAAKQREREEKEGVGSGEEDGEKKTKKGKKRRSSAMSDSTVSTPSAKQPRLDITKKQRSLIKEDDLNKKLWDSVLDKSVGKEGLYNRIQDTFACVVCQELVYHPVTSPCCHNICKTCLSRSFKAEVFTCPSCRHQLGKDFNLTVNQQLQAVLLDLFPGYNAGR